MSERIFIGVAWPYANGPLHLGHIAGCYLPADIFARYHRLKGNEVLMVSGSDSHGTPITIRAEQEGTTPAEVVKKYHAQFLESWGQLGISFDLYTATTTQNHAAVVHDIFINLMEKGHIYKDTMSLPYCDYCKRFLPDRYVEGTCPHCSYERARGDQCERCGKTLNPEELIGMRCRISGHTPVIKQSEHLFLRLGDFQKPLLEWVERQEHWRANVLNFTRNFLREGLRERAITRDTEWGVSIPLSGYDKKRIYVWFEAVVGYLSASKEWAKGIGKPEKWQDFWQDPSCRSYYFIGKDNIPFHTIIWPAMLLGYGGLNLPYDVPANEFLSLEGQKFSTSQNWAVWLPDYLSRYDPDPLRYYLSASMPESSDSDFSWAEFLRRNNDELVATYGNLVHRILTFTYRNFGGKVPQPGELAEVDCSLMASADKALAETGHHLSLCHFREALSKAMGLASEANRYIDAQAPWRLIKENRDRCATVLWTALYIISTLKTLTYPYLPFSAQKLHVLLGFQKGVDEGGWQIQQLQVGQPLQEPSPLFAKLDDKMVQVESERLSLQKLSGA